jgi:hypothetical protein
VSFLADAVEFSEVLKTKVQHVIDLVKLTIFVYFSNYARKNVIPFKKNVLHFRKVEVGYYYLTPTPPKFQPLKGHVFLWNHHFKSKFSIHIVLTLLR